MYTPFVRLLFGVLGIALAIKFYLSGSIPSLLLTLGGVALVVWGYFRNGTVFIAFQQVKKNNPTKAERLLAKIKKPEWLSRSQKAYYHFTRGFVKMSNQQAEDSLSEFRQALEIGLRTDNDKAIALLNISSLALDLGNIKEARESLKQAKSFKYIPNLEPEIKRIERELQLARRRNGSR